MGAKMKSSTSTKLGKPQAQAAYAQLPEKFRRSVVGHAYASVLELMGEVGDAPLDAVLEALFPDRPADKARQALSTQYVNRPYEAPDGQTPLRLRMSRAGAKGGARVWFEGDALYNPADFTPSSQRYAPEQFESMQARQATGEELKQAALAQEKKSVAVVESPKVEESAPEAGRGETNHVLRIAEQDMALGRDAKYWQNFGRETMRHGVNSKDFTPAQAQRSDGFAEVGEKVLCLDAMLRWAWAAPNAQKGDQSPASQARLLALLGDYGTGKTSHCLQFVRTLNGEVPVTGDKPPVAQDIKALHVDLAELAGVSRLAELSLQEMLSLVLAKQVSGGGMVRDMATQVAAQALGDARQGKLIIVYDGLDELLQNDSIVMHKVFDQLLKVLEPAPGEKESRARVVVSCRTHYFRSIDQQLGFFGTRHRGAVKKADYLCLTLLPWSASNVAAYLRKRLSNEQADKLLEIIRTTYNLEELASRPVLLAMMSEQVGDLLRAQEKGEPITAARLYGITVAEWVNRDNGKHHIAPEHKPIVMGALASAMWSESVEQWDAERLDVWLLRALEILFPGRYSNADKAALQDDLRTATFIVRPDADRFNFAHRSFMEYFLARFVLDAMRMVARGEVDDQMARELLPVRLLNHESGNFVRELWGVRNATTPIRQLEKEVAVVWTWMQHNEVKEFLSIDWRSSMHGVLLQQAINLRLPGKKWKKVAELLPQLPIRMPGMPWLLERAHSLDFSYLPGINLEGAWWGGVVMKGIKFPAVMCNAQTVFAQSVFCDCDTSQFVWSGAEVGGMIVRNSEQLRKKQKSKLLGPWTLPVPVIEKTPVCVSLDESDDGATLVVRRLERGSTDLEGLATYDVETGRCMSILLERKHSANEVIPCGAKLLRCGKERGFRSVAAWRDGGVEVNRATSLGDPILTLEINGYVSVYAMDEAGFVEKTMDLVRAYQILNGQVKHPGCNIHVECEDELGFLSYATFDPEGHLIDFNEEAANTWLFTMANGRPEPVEMAPEV
jgi:Cdc6-like AAA superfamily ATPase